MLTSSEWEHLLKEWDQVVRPVVRGVIAHNWPEYEALNHKLRTATLQEIDRLPTDTFGAIGDAIPALEPEACLWLIPVLLRFGSASHEPVYARSAVEGICRRACRLSAWPAAKGDISTGIRQHLYGLAIQCCELGWTDTRRIIKRSEECKAALP